MSNRLSVLMTVYNEADFIEYAIWSCLPYVNDFVIVEGAYQETIALGANPHSTDGTIEKIKKFTEFEDEEGEGWDKLYYIGANEQTDKDQRNIGLEKIKELNPDGWLLIVDGDEVYDKSALKMVKIAAHKMEKQNQFAAYFKSLTFVNDFRHYAEQEFPRLFRITPECKFVNDNFMEWPDENIVWFSPQIIKIPYIKYHHYAFCKNLERFYLKEKWWKTRFGKDFDYGWHEESGKIKDENHKIVEYTGKHPEIMKTHKLWKLTYA